MIRRSPSLVRALTPVVLLVIALSASVPAHAAPFEFNSALRLRSLQSVVGGTITPNGMPTTVTIGTSGDTAEITFTETAGTRISLSVSDVSLPISQVSIVRPDGSTLDSRMINRGGDFFDPMSANQSGTYTIKIEPYFGYTGSMTLGLFEVPADISGTIAVGGAAVTPTTSPGQNARYTFSGTQNQRISLTITGVSLGGGGNFEYVTISKPDGTALAGAGRVSSSGGFIDVTTLPTSGTYTITVDPQLWAAGSSTLTLYEVPGDVTTPIAVGGATVTPDLATPGQDARLPFRGAAGQPVRLSYGSGTLTFKNVAILKPDGSTLASTGVIGGSSPFYLTATLPTDGIYTAYVDAYDKSTGTVPLTLTQESAHQPVEQTYGDCDGGIDALNQSDCLGDIDPASGAYSTSATDISVPGIGVPFTFTRSYTSADPTSGRLGPSWTDNLATSLVIQPNGDVLVHGENGQQLYFSKQSDGSFVAAAGGLATLSLAGSSYTLLRSDQTRMAFNAQGRLISSKDRNNQGLTLAYDGNGRLATVTDSAGRVITFTSNPDGTLREIALPDGRHVDYGYASGRLSSVTDMRGGVTSYTYDAGGRLATIVDPNSHTIVTNTYGTDGRLVQQVDALNRTTAYGWDAATQTQTMTDPRGNAWKDVYQNNLLIKRIDPLGNTTQYGYDANNNQTSVTDARGKTTTMTYDARHNLLTRTAPAPLSYQESWTYNAFNDALSHTDGRANTTSYGYDAAGNLTSKTEPGNVVTAYTRDAGGTGMLVSQTDPRGKTTTYGYDAAHNLTSVTQPLGEQTTMGYNGSGRLTTRVDPRGNVTGATPADYTTTFTYDNLDRKTAETDPLGHETQWSYDPVGNLLSTTNADNHTTSYVYDTANQLTSVTVPGSATTSYVYDANGNRTQRTDANDHTTTYAYNAANQRVGMTDPLNRAWSYAYDGNGNKTQTTAPGGGTIGYSYDVLNRLSAIDYSDSTPDVAYSYDANGNRTQMTDGAGTQSSSYDALNRLTAVTRGSDSFGYGYDDAGNVTSRTYPGGTQTAYTYDNDGRLASASSGGATTSYSYDAAGNPTSTTLPAANGYAETRIYDRAGRLTELKNAKGASVLSQYNYSYDPLGKATQLSKNDGSVETYTYDSQGRLTEVCYQTSCPSAGDPFIRWSYDPAGNRLSETRPAGATSYSYDSADQLTQTTAPGGATTSYGYDARGNQTAAGSRSFSFNLADRETATSDAGITTNYSYDGDGNRLSLADGTSTINYLWDSNNDMPQLALERDGAGNTLRTYIRGLDTIAMTSGGNSSYYHRDRLGSITGVTSATGQTEWAYSYEPFGTPRTTTQLDPNAPTNPLRWDGQYQDPATALVNLRARQYDPASGRFTSTDPIEGGSLNNYDYASQDPINNYDLDGTRPRKPTRGDLANLISILTGAGVVTKPTPKPEPKGKPPTVQPNPHPKPEPPGGVVIPPASGEGGEGKAGDEGTSEGSGESGGKSDFTPIVVPWVKPIVKPIVVPPLITVTPFRQPWVLPGFGGRSPLRWP